MADRVWQAVAPGNWSDAANWDGGASVPTGTDKVTFGPNDGDCTIDNLGSWSGGVVDVLSTYGGQITQGVVILTGTFTLSGGTWNCNGQNFSCGSATATVAAATWTQGSGTITTGAFVCNNSSGTITATSSTWNLGGSFTRSNNPTFTANGGTINITAASTFNPGNFTLNLVTFAASNIAITISAGVTCPLGADPTIGTGSFNCLGTLTGTGTLTWNPAVSATLTISSGGTVNTFTAFVCKATFTVASGGTFPTIPCTFDGSAFGTTVTATTTTLGTCTINKTNQAFTVAANTTVPLGSNPTSATGSSGLTVSGTVTWSGKWTLNAVALLTCNNGSTLTGTSTPTMDLSNGITINATTTITNTIGTITLVTGNSCTITDASAALQNSLWVIAGTGGASAKAVTVGAGAIVNIGASPTTTQWWSGGTAGNLTVNGTLQVSGDWNHIGTITVGATGTISGALTSITMIGSFTHTAGGTMPSGVPFTFTGALTQVITATVGGFTFGTCVFNKTNSSATVAAGTTVPLGADPTTNLGTGTLTVTGTLDVSGSWTHTGGLTVTAATGIVSGALTALSITRALTVGAGGTFPSGVQVAFLCAANVTIDAAGVTFGTCTMNVGAVAANPTIALGTTIPFGANPTLIVNQLTVSGTITASGMVTIQHASGGNLIVSSGGVLSGAVTALDVTGRLNINSGSTVPSGMNLTMRVGGALTNTFTSGGKTYGVLRIIYLGHQGSTPFEFEDSGTFTEIRDTEGSVAHSLLFTAGTTQTVGDFNVAGGPGKLVTLDTDTGSGSFTLTSTNPQWVFYCSIKNSHVDTNDAWVADSNCVNAGGNAGWVFSELASGAFRNMGRRRGHRYQPAIPIEN